MNKKFITYIFFLTIEQNSYLINLKIKINNFHSNYLKLIYIFFDIII